jgi:hypothetical protein
VIGRLVREAWRPIADGARRTFDAGELWLFGAKRASYGIAVMRILLGLALLGSLVTNFGARHYVWGGGARWLQPSLDTDGWGTAFTAFFGEDDSPGVFTVKYLILAAVAVLFTIGWRTRIVTPVLLVLSVGLMRLDPLATDAGDNVIRLMLLYMCFADVSGRWSLDARRRAKGLTGPWPSPPWWLGVVFHNVAVIAIAAQVFIVYMTSGLSKVRGEYWQEGVGLYFPLRIGQYEAWPGLNELVYSNGLVVTVGSYVTVFVQVLFPVLLLRRGTRVLALVTVGFLHLAIAVTMALPWFSLAMVASDAIFIRDVSYSAVTIWIRKARNRDREPVASG